LECIEKIRKVLTAATVTTVDEVRARWIDRQSAASFLQQGVSLEDNLSILGLESQEKWDLPSIL
jgi:hypothetical protein